MRNITAETVYEHIKACFDVNSADFLLVFSWRLYAFVMKFLVLTYAGESYHNLLSQGHASSIR
jgi:hypothetical protein